MRTGIKWLAVVLLLIAAAFALDGPCSSSIFDDDPTYTVSGHVQSSYRTPETFYENPKTFVHFSDGREACFTESLSPDAVKSGQDVIYTYKRHCHQSCYTFVKSEVKK